MSSRVDELADWILDLWATTVDNGGVDDWLDMVAVLDGFATAIPEALPWVAPRLDEARLILEHLIPFRAALDELDGPTPHKEQ